MTINVNQHKVLRSGVKKKKKLKAREERTCGSQLCVRSMPCMAVSAQAQGQKGKGRCKGAPVTLH